MESRILETLDNVNQYADFPNDATRVWASIENAGGEDRLRTKTNFKQSMGFK